MESEPRQDKRLKIYEAALEAYARNGIHSATARQIAEIAGIGKSTIFEYFKSLEELRDRAFEWYIAQSQASWKGLRDAACDEPAKALSDYFDSLTALILHEPEKLLLISQYVTAILASGTDFEHVKREYKARLQPSADALTAELRHIVSAGVKSGVFKPAGGADEEDCVLALTAIAREMQSQALVQDETQVREACLRLKRMAFRILGNQIYFE